MLRAKASQQVAGSVSVVNRNAERDSVAFVLAKVNSILQERLDDGEYVFLRHWLAWPRDNRLGGNE